MSDYSEIESFPPDWPRLRVGDIASVKGGKRLPAGTALTPSRTSHPYIRIVDFKDGRIDKTALLYVPDEVFPRIARYTISSSDIYISIVGTIGLVGVVDEELDGANLTENAAKICNIGDHVNRDYLAAFLRSGWGQQQIGALTVGSTQPKLALFRIEDIRVPVPPLPEQQAIAHILGTLDDKIDLNRQMNETLEAMARALFKSWFVDFDPVRAKSEGRDPGLPPPLADLFPDSFEDSELGEIPSGWTVGKLGDLLTQRLERCVASPETAARPYVPIDCISSKSLFLTESKAGEEAQSSLTKFYKGDLLFGAMRPYFHKVCIAPFDGTTRTTAFVLFPRVKEDFEFASLLLHHPHTIDYATRHSTGSTIPYALWSSSLEEMPVIVPPSVVRSGFGGVLRPILDRIPSPYFENETLKTLRDTLLPKLISGDLRVKDAERFVGGQV